MTGKAHGGWLSRVFTALLCLGWNECGNERRGRREIAEGAEGMRGRTQKAQKLRRSRRRDTKLFKKACKQYPCGLQAKNGWKGAWMLVVGVLPLIVATPCACLAAGAARGRRVRRRGLDAGAADFLPVYFLQFAAHDWLAAYGAGLRGFHFGFGWQLGGYFGDGK